MGFYKICKKDFKNFIYNFSNIYIKKLNTYETLVKISWFFYDYGNSLQINLKNILLVLYLTQILIIINSVFQRLMFLLLIVFGGK